MGESIHVGCLYKRHCVDDGSRLARDQSTSVGKTGTMIREWKIPNGMENITRSHLMNRFRLQAV